MFEAMLRAYGPRHWWPGDSPDEIVIGAILTQNTSWKNVERAITRLKSADMIDWIALEEADEKHLAETIRPAGYHNLKAKRLKNFARWLRERYESRLDCLKQHPLDELRKELLSVNGIGPETADSILLYALEKPTFVVDAYTGRIARRHGLIDTHHDYASLKAVFETHLPRSVSLYNEYHALLVEVGKRHCGPTAKCDGCPLARFEHDAER